MSGGFFLFLLIAGGALLLGYLWGHSSGRSYGELQVNAERRASQQARVMYEQAAKDYISNEELRLAEEKKHNEANLIEQKKQLYLEVAEKKRKSDLELAKQQKKLDERENFIKELESAFDRGFLNGRKWLASMIAAASKKEDEEIESVLRSAHRAPKAADKVKAISDKYRDLKEENVMLHFELETIKEYFPLIAEFEEELLEDRLHLSEKAPKDTEEVKEGNEEIDPVRKYLSPDEWEKLSVRERNQLALDRYKSRHFSKAEIGRFYERQLGYEFEQQGYSVKYFGIEKGLEDLGRDLVCTKRKTTIIVQAKCWSNEKTIHEKHIYQLFGTTTTYRIEHPKEEVEAHFYTTTSLSIVAKEAADRLGIHIHENYALNKDYPIIKCNVGANGEKIYHLPFDQQYDKTQIRKTGERYATTVAEAERFGFRRAKRWFGTTS